MEVNDMVFNIYTEEIGQIERTEHSASNPDVKVYLVRGQWISESEMRAAWRRINLSMVINKIKIVDAPETGMLFDMAGLFIRALVSGFPGASEEHTRIMFAPDRVSHWNVATLPDWNYRSITHEMIYLDSYIVIANNTVLRYGYSKALDLIVVSRRGGEIGSRDTN